jgi:O-antigen/teichoic acid export membrane protein
MAVLTLFIFGVHSIVTVALTWTLVSMTAGTTILAVALAGLSEAGPTGEAPTLRELATFGLKGLLGATSPVEAFQLDQIVIGLFLSAHALGLYVVALAFTSLPRLVAQSIGMVAYPDVAQRADREEAHRVMWHYVWLTALATAVIVVVLVAAAGELVPLLFGREFASSVPVARILLAAGFFLCVRRVLVDAARGAGHPGVGTLAEVGSWVVFVPALGVLTPLFGIDGVAAGMAAAAVASLAILLFLLTRLVHLDPHGHGAFDEVSSPLAP